MPKPSPKNQKPKTCQSDRNKRETAERQSTIKIQNTKNTQKKTGETIKKSNMKLNWCPKWSSSCPDPRPILGHLIFMATAGHCRKTFCQRFNQKTLKLCTNIFSGTALCSIKICDEHFGPSGQWEEEEEGLLLLQLLMTGSLWSDLPRLFYCLEGTFWNRPDKRQTLIWVFVTSYHMEILFVNTFMFGTWPGTGRHMWCKWNWMIGLSLIEDPQRERKRERGGLDSTCQCVKSCTPSSVQLCSPDFLLWRRNQIKRSQVRGLLY